MSATPISLAQMWPELFAPLEPKLRRSVLNTLACGRHEGWVPDKAQAIDLIAYLTGQMTETKFTTKVDPELKKQVFSEQPGEHRKAM